MPTNPGVSEVQDKNGVIADIEAKRFDGTRTVQIQGDVTATQTWNGDSNTALTLNASIGAKKVTQDKIADKAVGTGQMADGSVGLTQMAASAMTDTVSANNSKLVTSQGVNAAIAAATLNRGKDYGPMSVDEINAISETIPTGSTVYVESLGASDAKVINDGYSDGTMASFSVEVGEDLKYYRAPDNSLHGWYSTEANVKIKQPANYAGGIAVDSAQDASSGSADIEFIRSFKQDTNGNIRDIVKAQVDIVDSTSSTRTNAAATPNSVKSAYDLANTANTGLANKLDKTGDGKDVTATFTEASTRANIRTGEKLSVMFGKIKKWFSDLKALAFKDMVSDSDISGTISDNHIASASTWNGKQNALPTSGTAKTTYAINISGKASSSNDVVVEEIGSSPIDIDTLTASDGHVHFYYWGLSNASNVSNRPTDHSYTLKVLPGAGNPGSYVTQIAYRRGAVDVYIRRRSEGSTPWGGWVKLANTSEVDGKADKVSGATNGNLAALDSNGNLTDSGKNASDFATSAQGSKADSAIQGVKVNNTTLTPDANNVVTVPIATTSADGAMSAADKTKLNGIAEGAEANVQSDWNEADSSSDAFIKNKPLYSLYSSSASYKVIASVTNTTTSSGVSWSLMYTTRLGDASAFGVVQGHGDIRCSYIKTAGDATSMINFYTAPDPNAEGRTLIIAYLPSYTRFQATSFVRKSEVDFSVFGNNPPEGTTYTDSNLVKAETIAQSEGSSGTAPVKVDESGELTPVPMDSTPTESSPNLMTSGAIKTALDGKQDSLTFMNDTEAVAIWADAKTAAANAS